MISKNKGISYDGISDYWIKNLENTKYFLNLWKYETIELIKDKSFRMRIVPLNKQWPNLPGHENFRPIIVLSPLIKLILKRFEQKINKYIKYDLSKS